MYLYYVSICIRKYIYIYIYTFYFVVSIYFVVFYYYANLCQPYITWTSRCALKPLACTNTMFWLHFTIASLLCNVLLAILHCATWILRKIDNSITFIVILWIVLALWILMFFKNMAVRIIVFSCNLESLLIKLYVLLFVSFLFATVYFNWNLNENGLHLNCSNYLVVHTFFYKLSLL